MYRFIIDYEHRQTVAELPLPPEVMTTRLCGKNTTVDLVNSGEISVLKDIGLRNISFRVLLPKDENVGISAAEFHEPLFFLSLFRNIMADKRPFRLIILRELPEGRSIFNGDIMLSIESYTVVENGGEEGDFYVDLNLKEFRTLSLTVAETAASESAHAGNAVREVRDSPKTYSVVSGDCLYDIAKKQLGDGELYRQIAEKNGIDYPYTIYPGQILKLG